MEGLTFLVCLPRSRSAWLASFLSKGASTWHDPLVQCASISELRRKIEAPGVRFVADTSAAFFLPALHEEFPEAKYLFVQRDPSEVRKSLSAAGMSAADVSTHFRYFNGACEYATARELDVECVSYNSMNDKLRSIWRFVCGMQPFDEAYAARMAGTNVQVSVADQIARVDPQKMHELFSTIGRSYL